MRKFPEMFGLFHFFSFYALEARGWILVKMLMLSNCEETSLIEVFEYVIYENRGL